MINSSLNPFKRIMLPILIIIMATAPICATAPNALDKARALRAKTTSIVDSLNQNIQSINADSVSETVVFESAEESDWDDDDISNVISANSAITNWQILPIVAVVFGTVCPFAALVLIILIIMQSRNKRKKMKYDAITRAAEAGHPLPPAFYKYDAGKTTNRLQSDIVWIGWGTASAILSFIGKGSIWLPLGIILIFVGAARLAVYYTEQRRTDSDSTSHDAE